jgi:hypothetical protein
VGARQRELVPVAGGQKAAVSDVGAATKQLEVALFMDGKLKV